MKDSKAVLMKHLRRIANMEDKYFPGYLGNPQTLGAFVAGIPQTRSKRIAVRSRQRGTRRVVKN